MGEVASTTSLDGKYSASYIAERLHGEVPEASSGRQDHPQPHRPVDRLLWESEELYWDTPQR